MMVDRHRVFVSFHHEDQQYKDYFINAMGDDIVDQSVSDGDIDDSNTTETMREQIRDDFISDAAVTIVLIGPCTWQRKHVDWEIGSSLRDTQRNSRCGLLGILLPNHPDFNQQKYQRRLIPPRLWDNVSKSNFNGQAFYATIHQWQNGYSALDKIDTILDWIHQAYLRRSQNPPPKNSRPQFGRNKSGVCAQGWQD